MEVPAIVDRQGVTACHRPPAQGIAGLLANQVAVHDLTAETALTGSREVALQALLVDPVVHSLRAATDADTMLRLQEQYRAYQ